MKITRREYRKLQEAEHLLRTLAGSTENSESIYGTTLQQDLRDGADAINRALSELTL